VVDGLTLLMHLPLSPAHCRVSSGLVVLASTEGEGQGW